MTSIPEHLTSGHPADICRDAACPEAVKRDPATGRYFITMGHPGFNSMANNGDGYASERRARGAVWSYAHGGAWPRRARR